MPQMFLKPNSQTNMHSNGGKINPVSFEDRSGDEDLDPDLITKAMNNSFIRQMSGAQEETTDQLIGIINIFALKHLRAPNHDIADRKWCIVELDETVFESSGFFSSIFACGAATNSDATDKPISLKLYCLVLNMENKQLHFQSLEDPNKHLFINFDTIPVHINELDENHPFRKELISLSVEKQLNIDIYISPQTMPFPYCKKTPIKEQ